MMKHKQFFLMLAMLMSMVTCMASTDDFWEAGIYYHITSSTNKTVSVISCPFYEFDNEYSGNVTIPESVSYNNTTYSVTKIGSDAFRACSLLTSISIPKSVTEIGSDAFVYCNGLTSIVIPNNSVTTIGQGAFKGCSGLTSIVIPNSVTTIGQEAFKGCCGLTSIIVDSDNVTFDSRNNCNAIIETSSNTLIVGCKNTSIPNNVAKIYCDAFYECTGLTSITIPKSVTSIGDRAFEGCTGLNHVEFNAQKCIYCGTYYSTVFPSTIKTVTIGDEVEAIPEYAFYGCTGLTSVTIGNRVTSIGKDAFYECTGLTSITIPNSVTSIGENAFNGCKNLISISISNSLTSIEVGTFQDCRGLTSFSIPNSVGSIGSDAFYGCTGLKELIIQDGNSPLSIARCRRGLDGMFEHCPLKVLYLGRDISYSIDNVSPFYENTLTSVIISNSVTKICSSYNPKNKTIKLFGTPPAKVIWLTNTPPPGNIIAEGKVNYVANDLYTKLNNQTVYPYLSSMFEVNAIKYVPVSPSERTCDVIDCNYYEMKKDIVIDKTVSYKGVTMTVKNIHPYALYEVRGLETLTLSNQGYIGDYAFANSEIKKKLNINNTVTGIGNYAYNNCIGLPYATIDLRGKIGNNAFQNCKDLGIAGIGGQVTSIGDSAFYICTELKWIDIANSVKSIGKCSFAQCKNLTSAKIGTGIRSIQKYAFYACSSLSEIQVGNNVQTIGNSAFSGCSTLPTIIIPKAVESIDNYAFYGCKSLKYVIMEDKDSELKLGSNGSDPLFADCPLDSIYIGRNISYSTESSKGYSPFYRNTKLRSVTINDRETEISENEFYGCANLKNVYIGNGVTKIANWAFSGCSSLDYFSFGKSVKSIGQEAFSDCTAMTKLYSLAEIPPTCGSQALDDINKWKCTLYVPQGNIKAYQQADQWKEFFFMEGTDAINDIYDNTSKIKNVYDLNGRKQILRNRGVKIVRQSDGTTKKVLIK